MHTQRLAFVFLVITVLLTVINLLVLMTLVTRAGAITAGEVSPVLRGRGLEIVDDEGRLRAQIIVAPATTMPDGQKYPETALFRLIDPNGWPGVKIDTSVDGSGISLAGDSERREWNGIQIIAEGPGSFLKVTNKDGREQLIQP